MIAEFSYVIALIASALWFAAAFRYFSFQHFSAAKVLVPKSARGSPLYPTVAALFRFLGGMNAAFALLSTMLLVLALTGSGLFVTTAERGIILIALAAAHFSQFIFNVPILMAGERQGESYWYVLSGPMRFIFRMDAGQTILNLAAAIVILAF